MVWRTAERLHAALAGRQLTVSDLRWPSLATVDLTGRTVTEVVARGEHLLLRTDGDPPLTLRSHLGPDVLGPTGTPTSLWPRYGLSRTARSGTRCSTSGVWPTARACSAVEWYYKRYNYARRHRWRSLLARHERTCSR